MIIPIGQVEAWIVGNPPNVRVVLMAWRKDALCAGIPRIESPRITEDQS